MIIKNEYESNESREPFTSTIVSEPITDLLVDNNKIADMFNEFKGHGFTKFVYHIKKKHGTPILTMYSNTASRLTERTLHIVFYLNAKYKHALEEAIVDLTYKLIANVKTAMIDADPDNHDRIFGNADYYIISFDKPDDKEDECSELLDVMMNILHEQNERMEEKEEPKE